MSTDGHEGMRMMGDADVAAAAALLAEPARAALVVAIISEGSLPASELAARARIASSTTSEHLARLVDGGFLVAMRRDATATTSSPIQESPRPWRPCQ